METSIFHSDRALRVEGPALASAGAEGLVPLRLAGTESINELYEYRLTLQTPDRPLLSNIDGDYDLSSFISREITCKIELDGSGTLIPGSPGLTGKPNKGAGIREISPDFRAFSDAKFTSPLKKAQFSDFCKCSA